MSYVQLRGSVPLFWSLESGKTKIDRSLESSRDAFVKHFDALAADYPLGKVAAVNLMNQQTPNEEVLTQAFKKQAQEKSI